jgi:thiol:disulfide interchange protein DsbG
VIGLTVRLSHQVGINMKKLILASVISALVASSAFAAKQEQADAAQQLVESATQGKFTVLQSFQSVGNLEGFVMQSPQGGLPNIFYADKGGQYMLYGTLIGPDGTNISEQDNQNYVQTYVAQNIEDGLSQVTTFTDGSDDAPYKMYVMMDANCSACHYFYNVVKDSIDSGDLQLEIILVSFVKPDSNAKAAAILAAQDSAQAIDDNESGFVSATEEGGIEAMEDIPADLQAQLDANMEFMRSSGLGSTPTLIFYNNGSEGQGELTYIQGAPRDMNQFLEQYQPSVESLEVQEEIEEAEGIQDTL